MALPSGACLHPALRAPSSRGSKGTPKGCPSRSLRLRPARSRTAAHRAQCAEPSPRGPSRADATKPSALWLQVAGLSAISLWCNCRARCRSGRGWCCAGGQRASGWHRRNSISRVVRVPQLLKFARPGSAHANPVTMGLSSRGTLGAAQHRPGQGAVGHMRPGLPSPLLAGHRPLRRCPGGSPLIYGRPRLPLPAPHAARGPENNPSARPIWMSDRALGVARVLFAVAAVVGRDLVGAGRRRGVPSGAREALARFKAETLAPRSRRRCPARGGTPRRRPRSACCP